MYGNNSVIDINLVGEGFSGPHISTSSDGGALLCHTNNRNCCRMRDNPSTNVGRGEWYFPNGTLVSKSNEFNIYRTRGHMVVRLNRMSGLMPPTGEYRCVIPGVDGINITRHITLQCKSANL